MSFKTTIKVLAVVALVFCCLHFSYANPYSDAVKLSDVQVITLYNGMMTTGRRSFPVPQLKCVCGTAGCNAFIPRVVQCYNRGFDGIDYQWECKTDMDNAYRFGQISVSCEGYSHPDDPYVLKGSFGLEYTIDLTEEGYARQQKNEENARSSRHENEKPPHWASFTEQQSRNNFIGKEIKHENYIVPLVLILVLVVIFAVLYILSPSERPTARNSNGSSTNSNDASGRPADERGPPPPPGFRPEFYPNATPSSSPSADNASSSNAGSSAGTGRPETSNDTFTGGIFDNPRRRRSSQRSETPTAGNANSAHEKQSSKTTKFTFNFGNAYECRPSAPTINISNCSSERHSQGGSSCSRPNEQPSNGQAKRASSSRDEQHQNSSASNSSDCSDKQCPSTTSTPSIQSSGTRTASGFGGTKRR